MEVRHVSAAIGGRIVALTVTAAVLALAAAPGPGAAQGLGPGQMGQARRQLEERIRARFAQIVQERLGLTDQQGQRLGQVVQSFQGTRRQLAGEENAVRRQVDSLLASRQPSDHDARSLLKRMSRLREEETRLSRTEQDSLLQVLSPIQLLRFNVLREEMGARIRRLRQLRRERGMPGRGFRGGGGPMPPPGTMPAPGGFF